MSINGHILKYDADPDPNYHFDADPNSDPDPNPILTHERKLEILFYLYSQMCFIFLVSVIDVKIFTILDSIRKVSGKKYSFALHWVEIQ